VCSLVCKRKRSCMHFRLFSSACTFLYGYCSTVQGLLDWFEVGLGFTELLFIQIDLCVICVNMHFRLFSSARTYQKCAAHVAAAAVLISVTSTSCVCVFVCVYVCICVCVCVCVRLVSSTLCILLIVQLLSASVCVSEGAAGVYVCVCV